MSTLKKIASELDLSVSTVSRILNNKASAYRISEKTVQRVVQYAEKIGYAPNLVAKGLQASQTFTIGLLVPDIANPFFASLAKHIENWASKENYSIVLADSNEDVTTEIKQLNHLLSRQVDGLIVIPVGAIATHFEQVNNQQTALLFVDRHFSNSPIPFVASDNYQGSFDATSLLADQGHQRICLIRGNPENELVQERTNGFIDAIKHHKLDPEEQLVLGDQFSMENGMNTTRKVLKLTNRPTAIFAMNNLIGLGVLKAIKDANLSIPDNISLIVFDDHPYFELLSPEISAVKQHSDQIGRLATAAILEQINSKIPSLSQKVETTLINRGSVKDLKG